MRVPIVHGVVSRLTEGNEIPWFICVFGIVFVREDMMDVLSLTEFPVPPALLALVLIAPEDCLPSAFPFCRTVYHDCISLCPNNHPHLFLVYIIVRHFAMCEARKKAQDMLLSLKSNTICCLFLVLSVLVRLALLEIETARRIAAGVKAHRFAVKCLVKDVSLMRLEYPTARHVFVTRQPCAVLAAGAVLLLPLDHVGCVLVHHGGACYDSVTSHYLTPLLSLPHIGQ